MVNFGLTFMGDIMIGVAAYAAGALTWPWLKAKWDKLVSAFKS